MCKNTSALQYNMLFVLSALRLAIQQFLTFVHTATLYVIHTLIEQRCVEYTQFAPLRVVDDILFNNVCGYFLLLKIL